MLPALWSTGTGVRLKGSTEDAPLKTILAWSSPGREIFCKACRDLLSPVRHPRRPGDWPDGVRRAIPQRQP